MLRKFTSLLLIYTVVFLSTLPSYSQTQLQKDNLQQRQNANETPKPNLRDVFQQETAKLEADKPFTEADAKKLEKENLNRQVKRNNLSTTAKVGIGLGIAAVVILVVVLATRGNDDFQSGPIRCGTITTPCP
jgi:hypothetical protein